MDEKNWKDACPALSAHAIVGPAMRVGNAIMHYVKNDVTGRYFRLGAREIHLLALMDGQRTVNDIGAAYQDKHGNTLSEPSFGKLLGMLASRGLLAGAPAPVTSAPALPRLTVKRYGEVYLRLINPGRLLGPIAAGLRHINGQLATYTIALLIGLCQLYAIIHHQALGAAIADSVTHPDPRVFLAFCLISYGAAFLHELGHGAMCMYYGGRVDDMGLMFRYMMLFPYCKLDDLVVLPNTRARTVVVLAGVIVNLLLLLPFVALDAMLPGTGALKQLCALMLVVYNLGSLVNLLPFLRFDGYMLVSVCRGQPELKEEAFQAIARVFKPSASSSRTSHQYTLLLYGVLYGVITVAAMCWAMYQWIHWTLSYGQIWAAALMPLLVLALAFQHLRSNSAPAARSESA